MILRFCEVWHKWSCNTRYFINLHTLRDVQDYTLQCTQIWLSVQCYMRRHCYVVILMLMHPDCWLMYEKHYDVAGRLKHNVSLILISRVFLMVLWWQTVTVSVCVYWLHHCSAAIQLSVLVSVRTSHTGFCGRCEFQRSLHLLSAGICPELLDTAPVPWGGGSRWQRSVSLYILRLSLFQCQGHVQ